MESQGILAVGTPPAMRHHARLVRVGTWVQQRYTDGSELVGLALVGKFDGHRFGVREVHTLEDSGRPYRYLGVVPATERTLEVYMGSAAPEEIVDRVHAFVRHMDQEGRPVVVYVDDDGLRSVERKVLLRWRLWRWVRRAVN